MKVWAYLRAGKPWARQVRLIGKHIITAPDRNTGSTALQRMLLLGNRHIDPDTLATLAPPPDVSEKQMKEREVERKVLLEEWDVAKRVLGEQQAGFDYSIPKIFKVGDKVLRHLPRIAEKGKAVSTRQTLQFQGPLTITSKLNDKSYVADLDGKEVKLTADNLIKIDLDETRFPTAKQMAGYDWSTTKLWFEPPKHVEDLMRFSDGGTTITPDTTRDVLGKEVPPIGSKIKYRLFGDGRD